MFKATFLVCPYCMLMGTEKEECAIRKSQLLAHLFHVHNRESTTIENTIASFKMLGLYEEWNGEIKSVGD